MNVGKAPMDIQKDEECKRGEDESRVIEELEEDQLNYSEEEEDVFSCKYCDFQTTNVEELDDHIIDHEEALLEDERSEDNEEEGTDSLDETFPESLETEFENANKAFPGEGKIKRKRRKKKNQVLPAFFEECLDNPIKNVFVCPFCGYQSMKKVDLNKHLKQHNQPVEIPIYTCSDCTYTTQRKCDMTKHLLIHCRFDQVPIYRCGHCTYVTKRKGDLKKHLLCHSKISSFVCPHCPYVTKRHGDLKKHMVCHPGRVGSNRTVFNCTECGYTSRRLNDLHKHAVLHRDKDTKDAFKCTKCDYISTVLTAYAKHVLSYCDSQEVTLPSIPTEDSVQDYIVIDEEDLHLYQLDKDNLQTVEVSGSDEDVQERTRKRRAPEDDSASKSSKKHQSKHIYEQKGDQLANNVIVSYQGEDSDS